MLGYYHHNPEGKVYLSPDKGSEDTFVEKLERESKHLILLNPNDCPVRAIGGSFYRGIPEPMRRILKTLEMPSQES